MISEHGCINLFDKQIGFTQNPAVESSHGEAMHGKDGRGGSGRG